MISLKKYFIAVLFVFVVSVLFPKNTSLYTDLDILYFNNETNKFYFQDNQYTGFNSDNLDFYSTKTTKSKDVKSKTNTKTNKKITLSKETTLGIVGGTFVGIGGTSFISTVIFGVLSIVYYNDSLLAYNTYTEYASSGFHLQREIDFAYSDFQYKSIGAARYLYFTIGFGSLTLVSALVGSLMFVYLFKPPIKKVELQIIPDSNYPSFCGSITFSI